MRRLFVVLILCFTVHLAYSQTEVLTNHSVIDMFEMGFDEQVIIAKIENTPNNFRTSIEELVLLKSKGLSGAVIKAMVAANKIVEQEKVGVFVLKNEQEVPLFPTVFSGSKNSTLGSELTGGLMSERLKSTIHDVKSRNAIVPTGECSFVFYFKEAKKASLHNSDWWFRTAKSPNEFALISLEVNRRKNCREVQIGQKNSYSGASIGVKNSRIVRFEILQISENVFKVITVDPLPPGEYCFYYQGNIPQGGVYRNQSVFDFSVREPQDVYDER